MCLVAGKFGFILDLVVIAESQFYFSLWLHKPAIWEAQLERDLDLSYPNAMS